MARIRTIKPQHWSDKALATMSFQAHLLWVGTWNFSDDAGVIEADLMLMRSNIFPRRKDVSIEQIGQWIEELVAAKFIIPFDYEDESYYLQRTFHVHQKIDKPQPSKVNSDIIRRMIDECSTIDRPCIVKESNSRVKGKESETHAQENPSDSPKKEKKKKKPPRSAPPPLLANGIRPGVEEMGMELPEMDVGMAIQRVRLTSGFKVTKEQVMGSWQVFKSQYFTGEKYYSSPKEIFKHFSNWIKDQKFSNGQGATAGSRKQTDSGASFFTDYINNGPGEPPTS